MSRIASTPLMEGLAFDSGPESLHAVQDYALSTGKAVRIERASGSDRRIVCSSQAPCAFFVQVYRQRHSDKTYGKWYIASLRLEHSAACNAQLKVTTRQIADLPAFAEAVRTDPKAKIESLLALVEQRYGLSLAKQKRLVYRARDAVKQGTTASRGNLLDSENSPLPPRQFVRRRRWEKKETVTDTSKSERMVWLDVFVETLLSERVTKHGKEFDETDSQKRRRELWLEIQDAFNATHNMSLTVDQLRIKFRLLQEQNARVRVQEEQVTQNPGTAVVYPRGWDVLVRYFGDDAGQSSSVEEHGEVASANEEEEEQDASLSNEDDNVVIHSEQAMEQESSLLRPEAPPKRRRLELSGDSDPMDMQFPVASLVPEPLPVASLLTEQPPAAPFVSEHSVASDLHERLDSIQGMQHEMVRSMNGMQQAVHQSTEAIRGLQQALNQSNQVNAALLDFLKRTPHV